MADRIAELRIDGLRTIESLRLRLDGLTVLIGQNGSGKSSIIEACQLLRAIARPEFVSTFHGVHGGMFRLLRRGATRLTLGALIESDNGEPPLEYELVIVNENGSGAILGESLRMGGRLIMERPEPSRLLVDGKIAHTPELWSPGIIWLGSTGNDNRFARTRDALDRIEVHVAFDTTPLWAARALGRQSALRDSLPIQRTSRLELFGNNLPNAYYALAHDYGEEHWRETLSYVRLGLGDDVERVTMVIDPSGGAIGLGVDLRGQRKLPATALSDGELAYLAFVALFRLENPRSLLAFDEPDLHLHPSLLARVVQFFEDMGRRHPVLLAVQSDALLDSLVEPARAVRACEINGRNDSTVVRSLDATVLGGWLQEYRGVGHIRSDGFLSQIVDENGT